jgi:hypothetical protein
MEKSSNSILIWSSVGTVLLMIFVFIFIQFQQSAKTSEKIGYSSNKEITMVLDYGNGETRTFKGPAAGEEKVWNLFQQAIAAGRIDVSISDHFVPQAIDGFQDGANGKHWTLYVNNIRQKFAPFEIQAEPGDEIVFRFE